MSRPLPTARQIEYQDWQFGLFLHFGIRTFYEGHRDWDGKPMPVEGFHPTDLDAAQWARTARQAGMRYAVMTAKHHDGFANWPTKYTEYSVANSPWRDGKGDVVREYVDAFRAEGLAVGLYYSPAQADLTGKNMTMADPSTYDDYFLNQVTELLDGTYGKIDMLWFDGCGSENHTYDWPRIIGEVRRMQPGILIFNMGGDPDYRWVGNEDGLAPWPCRCVVDALDFSIQTDEKERLTEQLYLPAECDVRMRDHNWFYADSDVDTVKSLEELVGMYYLSIGRGGNLLLNIGPDRRGHLPPQDTARLLEFSAEIERRFATPIATMSDFRQDGRTWTYEPDETFTMNHVVLAEDLLGGERIDAFRVTIRTAWHGAEVLLFDGKNVGHKAICPFPTCRARSLTIEVTEACDEPMLRSLELHHVPVA